MAAAQAEALAAATAAASSSRSSYDAAGLGFGSTHPGHFSYTRNAPYKGVNIGEPASGTGSSVVATNRVPLKKQSRGDGTLPGSDKAKEPIVCKDPLDYAQTKTRFRDPITLAAPQALGYVETNKHTNVGYCERAFSSPQSHSLTVSSSSLVLFFELSLQIRQKASPLLALHGPHCLPSRAGSAGSGRAATGARPSPAGLSSQDNDVDDESLLQHPLHSQLVLVYASVVCPTMRIMIAAMMVMSVMLVMYSTIYRIH